MIGCSKKNRETSIRENAFEQKIEKPGLNFDAPGKR